MALNDSFLQELRYKTDIGDVISTYVSLRRRGSTSVGLCPFHNEKTPSFTVYEENQSFYCFGCGAGGDVISFIKRIENLDYIDAVKLLAQRAGMQMPDDTRYDDSIAKQRRRLLEINRATARFYHKFMLSDEGRAGLDYFRGRGLSMKTINHFGLGYAPNAWSELTRHLKNQGFTYNEMLQAGVVKKGEKSYYDIFRNRVMTPIIDVRGNVIAFGGRVLDDTKPKYINTSDTLIYKKTNELFALNFAKDSGKNSLILCEGYMDVIAMHQAGFTNAVAGCGTALTNEQVRLISRYADEVVLAYDADEAGQKALRKAINLFGNTNVKTRIPALVGGKDPDEIIKTQGVERFKGMLEGASSEIEFTLLSLRSKYNLISTQGKLDFLKEALKYLVGVGPIEQDLYVSRLAEELGVDKRNIKAQLDEYKRGTKRRQERKEYKSIIENQTRDIRKQSYDLGESARKIRAEERLITILMLHPNCLKHREKLNAEHLSAGFIRNVYNLLCEKISNGYDVGLINFSGDISDNEMNRLSGVVAKAVDSEKSEQEFLDCIRTIDEEYHKKQNNDVLGMSDDAFRNRFKQNSDNT